jgi:hypothetical protein
MKSTLIASLFVSSILIAAEAPAATFEEIHNDKDLRPETFARHFADFKFVFGANVQAPKDFLAAKAGDCDDYSTFAAAELKARGFTARLVSVRMKNEAHVVCYVAEANGYLDYNYRARGTGIVPCGPELTEIGDAVAKSFKAKWTSASEFSYDGVVKRLVATTLAQNRPTLTASTATASTGNRVGQ